MITGFSERLTSLRLENGLSQKQAAEQLAVSQALLSHYEKGIRECGLEFLCRAADYYDVTVDYILGRSESRNGLSTTDFEDRDEDAKMSSATIYRAAVMAQERIESGSASAGQLVNTVYAFSIYRTLAVAAQQGFIPKRWFSVPAKYTGTFPYVITEQLIASFPEKPPDAKRRGGAEPVCLGTVISYVEDSIRKTAAAVRELPEEKNAKTE